MRHRALCLVALALSVPALPAAAEDPQPNIVAAEPRPPGPVATLVLAARLFALAQDREDPLLALAALSLSQPIRFREATGWTQSSETFPKAKTPAPAAPGPVQVILSPETLTKGQVMAMVRLMVEGDPDLRAVLDDIEARAPARAAKSAAHAEATLASGKADLWRIPFYGNSPGEVGLIGDGKLGLRVADENGQVICLDQTPSDQALCRFTPAWNGYFTVEVSNSGGQDSHYTLVTN